MKCPKCDYLGFDTGDRCKNCGYDFSLMAAQDSSAADPDLPLQLQQDLTPGTHFWLEQMGRPLGEPEAPAPSAVAHVAPGPPGAAVSRRAEPSLPLFQRASPHDDEPLVKLSAPRPPLAVRRTPEAPKLRTVTKTPRRIDPDPVLMFSDDQFSSTASIEPTPAEPVVRADRAARVTSGTSAAVTSGAGRRLAAAMIDHALLLAIDVTVIYFTLRMASLTMDDWRLLPVAPMVAFLGLVKLAYFCAFTIVGGQTVGKMAARIQVVTDDDTFLDPMRAIGRTLVGVASFLTLGLGFVPILVGDDRRALHDRVARTRVVALPSA